LALFPEPIAVYIFALAVSDEVPLVAVGACLARHEESAPVLRRLVEGSIDEEITDEEQATQIFRVLHILGGMLDRQSFQPVLRLVQAPSDKIDWLLGDAASETLPSIIVGIFDGDAAALFAAIENPQADGAVRDSLLLAAAFLTWEGRIDRSSMAAFLERFARTQAVPNDELVWSGWTQAIALLGLRHLEPLVSELEQQDRLDELLFDRGEFEALLEAAEKAPQDKSRFEDASVGYIDDVVDTLREFSYRDEEPVAQPVINPMRHVGRNDPCPCGSGKKAKRCCLAA
jgi:hypothetical protein